MKEQLLRQAQARRDRAHRVWLFAVENAPSVLFLTAYEAMRQHDRLSRLWNEYERWAKTAAAMEAS